MKFVSTLAAFTFLSVGFLACNSAPSESFLQQFKAAEEGKKTPAIVAHIGKGIVVSSQNPANEAKTKGVITTLANQMGFRVEANKPKRSWFSSTTQYDFTAFQAPQLAGITFQQTGDVVNITPDYKEELIIEWAKNPKEGYQELMSASAAKKGDMSNEIGMAAAFGIKDPKAFIEQAAKADEETRKAKAKGFAENVSRYMKDNGYKNAWLVNFRRRATSKLPEDSPFWAVCEGISGTSPVLESNPAFRETQSFWSNKGKTDTKATLRSYYMVGFEDASGKMVKTEPWSSFQPE
jgi:hypothetical protein